MGYSHKQADFAIEHMKTNNLLSEGIKIKMWEASGFRFIPMNLFKRCTKSAVLAKEGGMGVNGRGESFFLLKMFGHSNELRHYSRILRPDTQNTKDHNDWFESYNLQW